MKTVAVQPEADLRGVANGDFSNLSWPILIAAADKEQFEDFIWEQVLVCHEVRRLAGPREKLAAFPESKILITLPGWQNDTRTASLVEWWVNDCDRYTVAMTSPTPTIYQKQPAKMIGLIILLAIAWLLLGWLVLFR